jgi:large subunit ribosomal protein L9
VESLGAAGQVVSVKAGYARNYLLPQGVAYEASAVNLRRIEEEQKAADERARRDYLEGRRQLAKIEGTSLEFRARSSDEGRLFGSISAADILERLNALGLDFQVDRKQVILDEPIKDVGEHRVLVRLVKDVETEIEVRVVREED